MSKLDHIGVSDLIEQLKAELLNAELETTPMFSIDEVSISLDVAVTVEASGQLALKVLPSFITDAGVTVAAKGSGVRTQSLNLTLSPLLSREERIALFKKNHPEKWEAVEKESTEGTIRGF